jgi:hypothetical protein
LADRIPFEIGSIAKLAHASDARTSSLAVFGESGGLFVWGLVDQGTSYHDFVNFDVESGEERPGLFQASVAGVGHLVVYRGIDVIAELRVQSLVRNSIDALRNGPIHSKLLYGINEHLQHVLDSVAPDEISDWVSWSSWLAEDWVETLCRLLIRSRNHRHGGAFLLTPDGDEDDLSVKHRMSYDRLAASLLRRAGLDLKLNGAATSIQKLRRRHALDIPVDLYLREAGAARDIEDCRREVDGALWFVSLLTRVDGLVLMKPGLQIRGFGTEITTGDVPDAVYIASAAMGRDNSLRKGDYEHFGTRHRSMMRYCARHPNSVGFVLSQDGDVRAITAVDGKLAIWENLRLQLPRFILRKRRPLSLSDLEP